MKFGRIAPGQAEGAVLGHSILAGQRKFKKGHRLSAEDVAQLVDAGIDEVIAGRFEPEDIPEDIAAAQVAQAACGEGAEVAAAFTGRCNLYAKVPGVALIDGDAVTRLNRIDEAMTIATLAPYERVSPGQMLATVKVIPLSAPASVVDEASETAAGDTPLIRVAAFQPHNVGLVLTRLPGTRDKLLKKSLEVIKGRLESLGSRLSECRTVPHHENDVAAAISELRAAGCGMILVFGASAITDRRDVVPAGIIAAGGEVEHFGMPVDPGNLMLLARHEGTPIIGLPGCARSPKINGFDWVLERLLAGLSVTRDDIMAMGAGGLLKEIPTRPQPREGDGGMQDGIPRVPRIAALVLAAGQSRRMGVANKLLAEIDGKAMLTRVLETVVESQCVSALLVTGHEADAIGALADRHGVPHLQNPDYEQGLSTSLRTGLAGLGEDIDGVIVCLGDMPRLKPETLNSLIAAFNPVEGRAICVPTHEGKRGNPVLWGRRFFSAMKDLAGDVGAKHLIGEYAELVCEVPMDGAEIFLDIDTPEALALLTGKPSDNQEKSA
ncbi:NTP transferase domain-containing protein [Denitrobaculum tricleocarpae]|uniref:4-diphosphocytidyl-2C-methyl-D-erythritol kinase n=1 Tax=Denitrobaculum tricleocarpae TaxID=2591009 RepID=A0A545TY52_9PROT|nr:molybdopterin-binding/glycosyltransferase family 2 protein [Denitrobaculum tricleocarpae]TQV82137.1 4-diphosphocytidyl-2C-methyl-D-erythritol kinase [Denitrobaculum tricleocarpae]